MHNKVQLIHRWGAVAVVALLGACSSTPQVVDENSAVAAPVTPSTAAATPAATAAEAGAPAATAAAAAGATQAAATTPKKRTGYRVRHRGSETVWCRKETTLGSNIPQEMCYTEEQMAEIDRKTDAMTEDMRQRMNTHICAPNCSN
jgi:hypothetical protein